MAAIVGLALAFGAAELGGAIQREAAMSDVRGNSGPLTVAAQSIYRALSDADATAAAAFLHSGAEPAKLRQQYDNDIAEASSALAQAAGGAGHDSATITRLSANLPVYTGLVETARADNRLGYPIGAAYLREASALMRATLLPAAASLYHTETVRLAQDRAAAGGLPWLAALLGVGLLALLLAAGRQMSRRTNRTFNLGVVAAFIAVSTSLIWLVVSWGDSATNLHSAQRSGSAQVELLAQIRIAVLEARADESLTLVARGNGDAFETDYTRALTRLIDRSGSGGLLATAQAEATDPAVRQHVSSAAAELHSWLGVHRNLHTFDQDGQYPMAVRLAIGSGPTDSPAYFNRVDDDLAEAIDAASEVFSSRVASAQAAINGLGAGLTILDVLAIAAAVAGIQRRLAEYR